MALPRPVDVLNALAARHHVAVIHDVAYGPSPRQRIDIYRPASGAGPWPVAVWFYGGSWMFGRRQEYRFVAAALAESGMVCAVPDYRLFPEVAFPAFVQDGAAAVAAVRRLAAGLGGDPARVFVIGHSAGAYIALMLATWAGYLAAVGDSREALAGAVGIAGPYDFLPIRDPAIRPIFAPAADLRDTQPIAAAHGRTPPLLLLHGGRDRVCYPRNSLALATRVRAHGGRAEVQLYPRLGHIGIVTGFSPLFRWLSPVLADVRRFIAESERAIAAPA